MSRIPKLLSIPAAAGAIAVLASPAAAAPSPPPGFTISTFATAPKTTPSTTGADDVTVLGKDVFVGWQNGVGTMGEPNATTHQTYSTLVEYSKSGKQLHTWLLTGKIDGLGADPKTGEVIATVNEDGNSALYTIAPKTKQVTPFVYSPDPASATTGGVFTGGGTDGVTVLKNGKIFLSASNPTPSNATAVFQVRLHPGTGVASLSPTFADNATAKDALTGKPVTLALTDPDSSTRVPASSPFFGGQFMLDSQGDQQLIFAAGMGTSSPKLTQLPLSHGGQSAGTDDVQWTGNSGKLLIVDNGTGTIYALKGKFKAGQAFASLDTVGTAADNTEVDRLDLKTGVLTPFVTGLTKSKGLVWLP